MKKNQSLSIVSSKITTVTSFEDLKYLSSLFAQSGLFGKDTPQIIAVKILAGLAYNLDPFTSVNVLYVITGKVVMSAGLQARLLKTSGKYDYSIDELTNTKCILTFYSLTRDRLKLGVSEFSLEDAKQAKLDKKDNWLSYPRNMLFARAMANGIRWYCPDALGNQVYTADELDLPTEVVEDDVILVGTASDSDIKQVLPFSDEDSAVAWAATRLNIDLEKAKTLYLSTPVDEQNKKALNFYLAVENQKGL